MQTTILQIHASVQRHQRCWVHKTANMLNKLPKRVQTKAKLHEIWMAETRKDAEQAFDVFLQCYQDKYPKAVHVKLLIYI